MNRIFLSGISAIAGGAIVHVTEKETIKDLNKKNIKYEKLVKRLIDELNKKNKRIKELESKINNTDNTEQNDNKKVTFEIDNSDSSDSFEELNQIKGESVDIESSLKSAEESIISSSKLD